MRFPFVCIDSDGLVVTFWSSRFTVWVLLFREDYADQVAVLTVMARCLAKGQVVSCSTQSFHPLIDCTSWV